MINQTYDQKFERVFKDAKEEFEVEHNSNLEHAGSPGTFFFVEEGIQALDYAQDHSELKVVGGGQINGQDMLEVKVIE